MKIKSIVYVHYVKYSWEEVGEYQIYSALLADSEYRSFVCSHEIELEVPDLYDPTAQQIAALEEQKSKLKSEFVDAVIEIDNRIGNL